MDDLSNRRRRRPDRRQKSTPRRKHNSLLKLSEPVKQLVRSGKISAGHARLLVGHPNAEIAQEIIEKNLSVRQVEAQRNMKRPRRREFKRESKGAGQQKDADTRALEKRLSDALGSQAVSVDHRDSAGTLEDKVPGRSRLDVEEAGIERVLAGDTARKHIDLIISPEA